MSGEQTIHVELTVMQARALMRAGEFVRDCFAPSELECWPGGGNLQLAGQKIASALERQETFA
ncbi:MAG: hypothetical protein ABSG93_15130 [Solirubrobacteraceae bacterium]|jgi:hypothetical protein